MTSSRPYLGRCVPAATMFRSEISGTQGAVSSNNPYATKAGLEILQKGGNAIDAAVAVSLALGVVEPFNSGIGGGAFSLYYYKADDRFFACDARGVAPAAAYEKMFLGENGEPDPMLTEYSGRAVATPAIYRAYEAMLAKHGTMSLAEVSEPAIRLAREGFRCGFLYARASETVNAEHSAKTYSGFAELYLNSGMPRKFGELIQNPDLARTMEQVAENGVDWFYNGPIADEIVAASRENLGVLTMNDMAACRAIYREPVCGNYRGNDIVSMPPPSSGGVHIIQALNILENFDLRAMGHCSANSTHLIAEALKLMFADRSVAMGDPAFVKINLDKLMSKEYAYELAQKIDMARAQEFAPTAGIEAKDYDGCTTNFTVQDRFGNLLAQTQTIRNWWGCGVAVPGRGFVLNNNMADFSAKAGVRTSQGLSYGSANAVRPGKTPLSSMCPTIILRNGQPFMTVGSAGGPRIITSTLQTILNVLEYDMMMDAAIRSPIICALTKDQGVEMDAGFSPDTVALLEQKGHRIIQLPSYGIVKGYVNGILERDGVFYPGGTCRGEGGGGGILTDDLAVCMDGFHFEEP